MVLDKSQFIQCFGRRNETENLKQKAGNKKSPLYGDFLFRKCQEYDCRFKASGWTQHAA